jgi:hypothetical protein
MKAGRWDFRTVKPISWIRLSVIPKEVKVCGKRDSGTSGQGIVVFRIQGYGVMRFVEP